MNSKEQWNKLRTRVLVEYKSDTHDGTSVSVNAWLCDAANRVLTIGNHSYMQLDKTLSLYPEEEAILILSALEMFEKVHGNVFEVRQFQANRLHSGSLVGLYISHRPKYDPKRDPDSAM